MATYNNLKKLMDKDYKTDPTRPRVSATLKNAILGELPKAVETAPEKESGTSSSGTSSTGSANKTNPYTSVDSTKYGGGFKPSDKVTDAYNRDPTQRRLGRIISIRVLPTAERKTIIASLTRYSIVKILSLILTATHSTNSIRTST